MSEGCPLCRRIRLVLFCLLLGGGAGFAVLRYGGSNDLSMAATFVGALIPLLWQAWKNRGADRDAG